MVNKLDAADKVRLPYFIIITLISLLMGVILLGYINTVLDLTEIGAIMFIVIVIGAKILEVYLSGDWTMNVYKVKDVKARPYIMVKGKQQQLYDTKVISTLTFRIFVEIVIVLALTISMMILPNIMALQYRSISNFEGDILFVSVIVSLIQVIFVTVSMLIAAKRSDLKLKATNGAYRV